MVLRSFLLILAAAAPAAAGAQTLAGRDRWADSARLLIESAVRRSSPAGLDTARVLIERAMTAFPNDALLQHYDGYALYRKATLAQQRSSDKEVAQLLDMAREALEGSGKRLVLPETYALQSAVYGQIISRSRNPLAGMTLGRKSSEATDRAIEEGPRNPRVWLLRGIGAIFTPSMWGGGLDKAQQYLEKSVTLYESDAPARPLPAWGKAEAFLWLGQVYAKQGKADASRAAYETAIRLEPDNGWAKALLAARPNASPVR
jgi:tetratricopeptide (TPR) repeat protein